MKAETRAERVDLSLREKGVRARAHEHGNAQQALCGSDVMRIRQPRGSASRLARVARRRPRPPLCIDRLLTSLSASRSLLLLQTLWKGSSRGDIDSYSKTECVFVSLSVETAVSGPGERPGGQVWYVFIAAASTGVSAACSRPTCTRTIRTSS